MGKGRKDYPTMRLRMRALASESDPEPVVFILAMILTVFGGVLLFPFSIQTFTLPQFAALSKLMSEDMLGVITLALGLLGLLALVTSHLISVICYLYIGIYIFLAVLLLLATPYSTGGYIYAVNALAAIWCSFRTTLRQHG